MRRLGWVGFVLGTGLALALYVRTLCPDLYWFDSAELVNDAWLLDIPHPPGYPLFNLIAHAFTHLPFGALAWRVNLVSAVSGALAVGLFFWFLEAAGVPTIIASGVAAVIAVSGQMWELSTAVEVYTLEATFLALALLLIARSDPAPSSGDAGRSRMDLLGTGSWVGLALVFGALLFHRPTTLFFLVPWIALVFPRIPRPLAFFLVMGAGALPYLHTAWVFYFKASGPGGTWSINYFDFPRTTETFLRICTGTLYASNLGWLPLPELVHEIRAYVALAAQELTVPGAALGFLGLVRAFGGTLPPIARHLAAVVVANVGFFLFYNALEKDTMYVPSLLGLAALAALVVADAVRRRPELSTPVGLVLLLAAGAIGRASYPAMDRSRYHEARRVVESTARILPPRAVLYLTDDLILHPYLHLRLREGVRPDVTLQIVDGFGPAVEKGLRERLAAGYSVYSTLFYPDDVFERIKAGYRLLPRGFLYQVTTGKLPRLPRQSGLAGKPGQAAPLATWATGSGPVVLEGAAVAPRERALRRSDQAQVVLTWRWDGRSDPAVVFVFEPAGHRPLVWVFRMGYQGRELEDGRLTEEYLLKIPHDLPDPGGGTGRLTVGLLPSIKAALAHGQLAATSSRDWEERAFFKGREGAFVRAMERGVPAFAEVLEARGDPRTLPVEPTGLGPLGLVGEEER